MVERTPAFHTTRWTLVHAASLAPEPARRAALESLCSTYWPPVYAFVRRQGATPVQAEDLTQGFFARLLAKHDLALADPERGRFRAFLLTALRSFLANERERERALKRGGGQTPFAFAAGALHEVESSIGLEPAGGTTPEQEFERAWARAVLERALLRLGEEQDSAGKGAQWRALLPHLSNTDERGHGAELARTLAISENAVRVALHRLRKRFGELVRDEVRETVGPGEVEDEVRTLRRALE